MISEQLAAAFADFVKGKGLEVESLSLSAFPDLLIDYYHDVKLDGLANDDDALLFQCGTYDWGEGRFFEVDFTRQYYIRYAEPDDREVLQQRMTFYFDPSSFVEIGDFNVWSHDCQDPNSFREIVKRTVGYRTALDKQPIKFETGVEDVC